MCHGPTARQRVKADLVDGFVHYTANYGFVDGELRVINGCMLIAIPSHANCGVCVVDVAVVSSVIARIKVL